MPVARYFFFVGGVLLALLLVADWVLPGLPMTNSVGVDMGNDKSALRINSDRKWPERVVFDTSIPTIAAPVQTAPVQTSMTEEAITPRPAAAVVDVSAKVRDAFAQLQPTDLKKPETKPQPQPKRKIAKRHHGPRTVLVAQQPRFGFFGSNIW
jgi:hypothetical protein